MSSWRRPVAGPDALELLETFINTLLSAQADSVCGAEYGARSPEPVQPAQRVPAPGPGYAGRDGGRRGAEAAGGQLLPGLAAATAAAGRGGADDGGGHLLPARGEHSADGQAGPVRWGSPGLSRSQVSEMAKDLDEHVEQFRTRPLADGPYTFLAADALTMKVREGGRVVKVAVMVVTGVNADGYREILGIHTADNGVRCWLAGALPRPGRPRPDQPRPGGPGDLRRPHRPGRGDRRDAARRRRGSDAARTTPRT